MKHKDRNALYGSRNTYGGAYSGGLYVNSSAAYDIPAAYPERTAEPKQPTKRQGAAQTRSVGKTQSGFVRIMLIALGVLLISFTIIYRQSVILESNQRIKELEKELAALNSANQSMQTGIDMEIEMGEVEKRAREELGMMKPESNQMFYIDMNMPDSGSKGASK